MNFDHFIRELQQIQLIQEKLIGTSNNQEEQKLHQAISNVEALNSIITKLVDDISSNEIKPIDEFITRLNHELRTPLVPIMAYAEMLSHEKFGKLSHEQKKKIDVIIANAVQLQQRIDALINRNMFASKTVPDVNANHNMRETEQENLLLEKINNLLSTKVDIDNQEIKTLHDSFVRSEHKQKELEQEKLIIKETIKFGEQKIQHLTKKHYLTLAIAAIAAAAIFAVYSLYVVEVVGQQYRVPNSGIPPSNYVIQNLQGDTVNTWVAWNIENGRTIHIHVMNAANIPQNMIDAIKDAILSTKTITIDDSLTGKGPKGTSSTYYVGWEGAAADAYLNPTKKYIPQKFDVSGSPDGVGDVEIILTNDVNPDGYSGYTKTLVDGNQILKSKITIYKADKLDANNLEAIVRHEFGHAMGLGHSTASEDLMSPMLPDYPYISGCDVDALNGLYDGDKNSKIVCKK